MTQREIRLEPPRIDGNSVEFRWTVTPATWLHKRTSFRLDFPDEVDVSAVPEALWWRIGLICLHPLWPLLRPCRVVLPVRLAPGEREAWLRMCDAAVWTMEERRTDGVHDTARTIDLVESGPALEPLAPPEGGAGDLVAACFSGGRDSLTQMAMLHALDRPCVLVTTTSPLPPIFDHTAAGRYRTFSEVVRRRDVELLDVRSDYRENLDHAFALAPYGYSVNELTDCLLYLAVSLAVAYARGAGTVALAAEAEAHMTDRVDGRIIRHPLFMCSATTQRALTGVLAATGIGFTSITAPLRAYQVHRVFAWRYTDLLDLQFSCWLSEDRACSACIKCGAVAFNLMGVGVDPARIGIDLGTLLDVPAVWPDRTNVDPHAEEDSPGKRHNHLREQQVQRVLRATTPEQVAAWAGPDVAATYARRRTEALLDELPPPEPGYCAAFVELLPEGLRDGVRAIADGAAKPLGTGEDAGWLRDITTLSDWIAAPLQNPSLDRRRRA